MPKWPASVWCLRTGGCAVSANLVRSQANSTTTAAGGSSNGNGTQLVGLNIMGTGQVVNPAPNTKIDIQGVGFVVLNEQECNTANCTADASGLTSITVRAIRLVLFNPGGGAPLAEIIVSEAHSDAKFPS